MAKQRRAFIAGPLFSEFQRQALEEIDVLLRDLGVNTFLPHRDAGLVGWDETRPLPPERQLQIFREDVEALRSCDFVVAWLDGSPDQDAGTCVELGIAFERGMPVFGLRTDPRPFLNPMVSGVCGGPEQICKSLDGLRTRVMAYLAMAL